MRLMFLRVDTFSLVFLSLLGGDWGGLKSSANEEWGTSNLFGSGVFGSCPLIDGSQER